MPILKTEILGSAFEINYEDGEKDKLEEIIKSFKLRLLEFENLYGKVSDIKLIFLAALKTQDQVNELLKEISEKENENESKKIYLADMTNLKKEVIKLKDQINLLTNDNNKLKEINSNASNEINSIENKMQKIINNILDIDKDGK
tara:strand:- start:261 stop:695 length:435 start_codon:yes stop_codon:yes gene_type:complete